MNKIAKLRANVNDYISQFPSALHAWEAACRDAVSFEDFLFACCVGLPANRQMRVGQCYFFTLDKIRKDLMGKIIYKEDLDPYYNNKNIERFFKFLGENW